MVYDVTNRESFQNVSEWINTAKEQKNDIKLVLVGNKTDIGELRQVSTEEGRLKAQEMNLPFFEISAKNSNVSEDGDLVKDMFTEILRF